MSTDRRTLLATAFAAAATPALAQPGALGGAGPSKIFRTTEIRSGKVMGIANGPVWEFRGIPYGAPTGGRNRYMPTPPTGRWTGGGEWCPWAWWGGGGARRWMM